MNIIERWSEFGHIFEIEKLLEPVQKGAGKRYYRLYDNGVPALGGQWHYTIENAKARAKYVVLDDYSKRIEWLEMRVNTLERELFESWNI